MTPLKIPKKLWVTLGLAAMVGGGVSWLYFGTIQGVPSPIILKFIMDQTAREAYFAGDVQALHDRLNDLGVEEEIKAYYRPQIKDEVELDWYIHQLLYDRTGYVGKAYKLGANRQLVLKTAADRRFPQWFRLAQQVGVVADHREREGVIYLIFPDGSTAPYELFAQVYPIKSLRQMLRLQKRNHNPK